MYRTIEEYLINKLDDEYFIKKILLFFVSYLNMPFDVDNTTLLFKSLSANDVTTLKSDLTQMLDEYHKQQTQNKITICDERVRSIDECRIRYLFKSIEIYKDFDDVNLIKKVELNFKNI